MTVAIFFFYTRLLRRSESFDYTLSSNFAVRSADAKMMIALAIALALPNIMIGSHKADAQCASGSTCRLLGAQNKSVIGSIMNCPLYTEAIVSQTLAIYCCSSSASTPNIDCNWNAWTCSSASSAVAYK